jgi:hypothetical protein
MADKDKQPTQADFEKAWKRIKKGKGRLPMEDDMGPLPTPAPMAPAPMPPAPMAPTAAPMKKGGKVKTKCMASGGKVSQLAKANGIAVKGKSRGRII